MLSKKLKRAFEADVVEAVSPEVSSEIASEVVSQIQEEASANSEISTIIEEVEAGSAGVDTVVEASETLHAYHSVISRNNELSIPVMELMNLTGVSDIIDMTSTSLTPSLESLSSFGSNENEARQVLVALEEADKSLWARFVEMICNLWAKIVDGVKRLINKISNFFKFKQRSLDEMKKKLDELKDNDLVKFKERVEGKYEIDVPKMLPKEVDSYIKNMMNDVMRTPNMVKEVVSSWFGLKKTEVIKQDGFNDKKMDEIDKNIESLDKYRDTLKERIKITKLSDIKSVSSAPQSFASFCTDISGGYKSLTSAVDEANKAITTLNEIYNKNKLQGDDSKSEDGKKINDMAKQTLKAGTKFMQELIKVIQEGTYNLDIFNNCCKRAIGFKVARQEEAKKED